jgi:hypothetical protein
MNISISSVPAYIWLLLITGIIINLISHLTADLLFKRIKYKYNVIYYLEFVFRWDLIYNKLQKDNVAKRYFWLTIFLFSISRILIVAGIILIIKM